jgi:hypothetical protein
MQGTPESEDSLVGQIVECSKRSPVLQMLIAAYPPASVVKAGVFAVYEWWVRRRAYVFGNEIISLGLNPPEEHVKRREFVEAFGAATDRAMRTKRDEKIRLFARLFNSYVNRGEFTESSFDLYEEDLSTLDELGYREYQLLLLLRNREAQNPPNDQENSVIRTSRYWANFRREAEDKLGIGNDEFNAFLQRLTRTGLYEIISGTYWDYEGNRGTLTPQFEALLQRITRSDPKA